MELLKQGEEHLNKPNFMINIERPKNLTSNKIYNQFLKIVLSEYDFEDTQGNQDNRFYITMEDIKTSCNLSKKHSNYEFIYQSIRELKQHSITIMEYYTKVDKPTKTDIKRFTEANLISAWSGMVEEGYLYFEIPNMLLDHLKGLKQDNNLIYTQLNNEFINNFKHTHSLTMYELLKEHQKVFKFKRSFTELRKVLNLSETQYKVNADFKRYVIEKSLKEVLNTTDLEFDFEFKKERSFGKKIENHLLVTFKAKDHLTFNVFKRTFLHIAQDRPDLSMSSKVYRQSTHLTINKKGYIVERESDLILDTTEAIKVWQSLFKVYKKKPEIILRLLNITKEDFDFATDFMRG